MTTTERKLVAQIATSRDLQYAVALKKKRTALKLTQKQAAEAAAIAYASYIQAETYGRMGKKVRAQVYAWLESKPTTTKERKH